MGLGEKKPLLSSPQQLPDLPPPCAGQNPLYSLYSKLVYANATAILCRVASPHIELDIAFMCYNCHVHDINVIESGSD